MENDGAKTVNEGLSNEETELYDRQIRIWGFDTQQRIKSANVLLIGVNVLSVEIAKNLVLIGIKSLTIIDETLITQEDIEKIFCFRSEHKFQSSALVLINYLRLLNPLVDFHSTKTFDCVPFLIEKHHVVCCTSFLGGKSDLIRLDNECRKYNVPLLISVTYGLAGILLADLGKTYIFSKEHTNHKHTDHEVSDNFDPKNFAKSFTSYDSLEYLIDSYYGKEGQNSVEGISPLFMWFLRVINQVSENCIVWHNKTNKQSIDELHRICYDAAHMYNVAHIIIVPRLQHVDGVIGSIVGGIVSQEIIKVISRTQQPINNFFAFDGTISSGVAQLICYEKANNQPQLEAVDQCCLELEDDDNSDEIEKNEFVNKSDDNDAPLIVE